jgi:1-hydroxycarotenoid 3,4-desaturase
MADAGGAALRERHVVVVGAGVGGLVSALLLAHRGVRVTLVEAAAGPGGKMRQPLVGGVPIDSGPTVFTMRWVFEQIFDRVGASLGDHLALQPLNVLARHAWRSSEARLDLHADTARSADAIAQFSSPAEAQRFLAFCAQARRVYHQLEAPYIRASRPSMASMAGDLGWRGLAALASLGPFASLWHSLGRHFHDPRLRQLFGRYATYCGASPWEAPATLMLIAHVELGGVWSVDGGMHALARTLAALAQGHGASLRYDTPVRRVLVQGGRACGVELEGGERIAADAVVFNGDPNALALGLLGDACRSAVAPLARARRSLSALTWSLKANTSGFPLTRHNVFFDDDYASEFDDIFRRRRLPERGTVYVCAQDRGDDAAAPAGAERLLCLVNAPADGDVREFDAMEVAPCQERSLDLMARCGLQIDLASAQMLRTTPADFHRLFPGSGGALYGMASHGWMTPFRRPSSASRLPGLFLAGGGVHPGPGVPMAALSGQLAAETLMAHLASTSRSHRVRISGGMSTPSATTAATP